MTTYQIRAVTGDLLQEGEAESFVVFITRLVGRGQPLKGANLEGVDLRGAELQYARLESASLKGANLEGMNLKGANLFQVNFQGASMEGANLFHCIGAGVDFSKANLKGANLSHSNLSGSNFEGANLEGVNFERSFLFKTRFGDARLDTAALTAIKSDLFTVLNLAPAEVPGVLAALREGRVDGSVYAGTTECCCLIGTIAKLRNVYAYDLKGGLSPHASRPIERWFMGISAGDVPKNNQVSAITERWIVEWMQRP